jgi:hypothetical protein
MVARIEHKHIDGVECRWCGKCKAFKPIEKFGYSKATWDKLRSSCKDCLHENNVETKEQRTSYNKQYWQLTKDTQAEKNKNWREANQDRIKENQKRWIEENKEHKKKIDAEYKRNNRERTNEIIAKWKRENYASMKTDPTRKLEFAEHKLKTNTSRRIREILGQKKSKRCHTYVGCSLDKLRIILETQLQDGMSWDNYGENVDGGKSRAWHIDHKVPCNAFDFNNEIHKMACFHHKNLQPLWWDENIRKRDKVDKEIFNNYIKWYTEVHASIYI